MVQKWWSDGKFGLFMHWGLYSALAGEFNGKRTNNIAEWIMHDLQIPVGEYEKIAKGFTGKKFDADAIIKLAKEAGMKYICFTTKHHDGFAMYDSKTDDYNIVKRTPCGRDILKELQIACQKHGLIFGLYYSQAQDWHDQNACEDGVSGESKIFEKYFREKCLPQVKELLTEYGDVGLLWFDTPMYMTHQQSEELQNFVWSIQPNCMINGRIGNGLGDYMTTGDNFIPLLPYKRPFEVPATLNDTWGYKYFDHNWKSTEKILRNLVRIVSRGGNYLLNIGPTGDGEIPKESVEILKKIGNFLFLNGESIYGTKPTPVYPYDMDDYYFTAKPGKLFIHVFHDEKVVYLLNIHNKPLRTYLLSDGTPLSLTERKTCEGDSSWWIDIPENINRDIDLVICVEIAEDKVEFEPLHG